MPIEQLFGAISNISADSTVVLITYMELEKLPVKEGQSEADRIKEAHKIAIEKFEAIMKTHSEFIKEQMSGIQIANSSKSFADKLKI